MALRRGFAVVASIVVLIVVTGVVTAVQEIAATEDADAAARSPDCSRRGRSTPGSPRRGRRVAGTVVPRRRVAARLPRHRADRRRLLLALLAPLREGGFAMSTLVLDKVSRWFGNVVAVNDVAMTIGPGVTGLLGPNGAGKTTLMAMMAGFLPRRRARHPRRRAGLAQHRRLSPDRAGARARAELRLPHRAAVRARQRRPPPVARRGRGDRADPRRRRHGRAGRAPPRHLLQGHAAADQDRRRARARARPCCCSTSPSTASTRASGCT